MTAPFLTIFVGGNHEASNYLFELYYGGWVAPNIYYLGAANVIRLGPLRIASLSGIWRGHDYRRQHFERLPYNLDDLRSIYHVRELDVRKLLCIRTQVDLGISHDWPQSVVWMGNFLPLFLRREDFRHDAESGKLGSPAALYCLERLRPLHWFSAHLHVKYDATIIHGEYKPPNTPRPRVPVVPKDRAVPSARYPWTPTEASGQPGRGPEGAETDAGGRQRDPLAPDHGPGDGDARIPNVDGCNLSTAFSKRKRESSGSTDQMNMEATAITTVATASTNPDAIDVDVSDEEAQGDGNDADNVQHPVSAETTAVVDKRLEAPTGGNAADDIVAPDVREKLSNLSSTFAPKMQGDPSVTLPLPEEIVNTATQFTALSKPARGGRFGQFLELYEISPISEPVVTGTAATGGEGGSDEKLTLSYDPEWLAITRVFADELRVGGDPNDAVPQHKGEDFYRSRILEEEKWVEEHVVKQGRLAVPENFQIVAPIQDAVMPPVDPGSTSPTEFPNPQTAQFCTLVGIPNRFALSEEERDARIARGPRAEAPKMYHARQQQPHGGYYGSWSGRGGGRGGSGAGRGGGRGGSSETRSVSSLSSSAMSESAPAMEPPRGRGGRPSFRNANRGWAYALERTRGRAYQQR